MTFSLESETVQYDVAISIINYNSGDHTLACVGSILRHTSDSLRVRIVVVDNNSVESEFRKLERLPTTDHLDVVRSRVNLGFSGGHTLALQFMDARYYFFLNNDCLLLDDAVTILHEFFERTPDAALAAPQLFSDDGGRHCSFDYFPTLGLKLLGVGFWRFLHPERFPRKEMAYDRPLRVDLVSGSAMFVRAAAFDAIGGFDTTFFLYCEEEDIALRLTSAGHGVYLVPDAHVQHSGGGSTVPSLEILKEFYISFLYFYRKHYGWLRAQVVRLFLFVKLFRKLTPEKRRLATFVLSGAPMTRSLRHRQRIGPALGSSPVGRLVPGGESLPARPDRSS